MLAIVRAIIIPAMHARNLNIATKRLENIAWDNHTVIHMQLVATYRQLYSYIELYRPLQY